MQEELKSPARQKSFLLGFILLLIVVLAFGGGILYSKRQRAAPVHHYFPASITTAQMTIPVYYPVNLPGGYVVDAFKIVKQNIMTFVVTGPSAEKYYVSEQSLPANFDFVAFQKKFSQPDQYSTPIGNDTVGLAGSQLVGSIQTDRNVWIILNSANSSSIKNLETITRSLQQVSLQD